MSCINYLLLVANYFAPERKLDPYYFRVSQKSSNTNIHIASFNGILSLFAV